MKKLNKNFFYTLTEYPFSEVGDHDLLGQFDVQIHIIVFNKKKEKIGDAAFCYLNQGKEIWFCDYFDYGIEINHQYKRQGLGTEIIQLAINHSKRKFIKSPNHEDSTEEGKSLVSKFI